jgi:ParB family chromosome partitioning protein
MKAAALAQKPYPEIDIKLIVRNPEQPRIYFDQAELQETADSIKEHGVIQPIAVEECGDGYILHDGERRWLGAQLAGLKTIPAIITPPLNGTGPRERLERALVANVQRSEMHPIEEGLAYQRLITEYGYSIDDVCRRVGKHSTRVYFCISLIALDAEIQQLMMERKLPCSDKVRDAFLSIANKAHRIKMAQALAERKATARMVITACKAWQSYQPASGTKRKPGRPSKRQLSTPWLEDSDGTPVERMIKEDLPEWDALYQLGKVPPWPVVTEAAMATCDRCPLRKMACDAVCRDCALVAGLRRMMEAAHGHQ